MRVILKKSSQFILILVISFGWIFSGWPQVWHNPPFPPEAKIAYADSTTKTYSFPANTEGWSATACGAAGATCIWQSSAGSPANGSLEEPEIRKNKGGTWTWQLSGITWESLGVPSGATVTAIDGSYNHTMATCTDCHITGGNTSGTLSIRNSGDTLTIAALETAVSYTGAAAWTSRNASGAQSIGASYQASDTSIILRLSGSIQTNNVNNATAIIRQDEISLTITYTPEINTQPNQPTNSAPADTATDIGVNPTLTGSTYADDDSDPHANTEWRVDDDVDFSTPVWTRTAGSAETSTTVNSGNGTFANELSGETQLAFNTQYYWQVRYSDGTDWSSWSDATSFTSVNITVSVTVDPVNFAYGNVGQNTASTTLTLFGGNGVIIENTGNVNVDIDIFSANTADWTLTGSTGSNQYVHQFCNDTADDCSSPPTNYTALTTSPQSFALGVPPSGTVAFQLRLITPNPSSTFSPQSSVVTIQATAE